MPVENIGVWKINPFDFRHLLESLAPVVNFTFVDTTQRCYHISSIFSPIFVSLGKPS